VKIKSNLFSTAASRAEHSELQRTNTAWNWVYFFWRKIFTV